jgi:hypothetical protein
MIRRLSVAVSVVVSVLLLPGTALAAWNSAGSGSGAARADVAPSGGAPSVSVSGRNVTVSWAAALFGDGTPVDGYTVARYEAGTGTPDTVLTDCDGTIAALTCTEGAVPPGDWRYRITPEHELWTGGEGPNSPIATVGAPSFAFSSLTDLTTLPATLAGDVTDYVTGESVEFRLDSPSGPLLTGSTAPDPIPFSGAATTSVTIPAGTTEGSHDIYAVGSDGSVASDQIRIDTAAPVVSGAVIQKSAGGLPGLITQGGTYYVYADVTDVTSGVATVTADVSTVTAGSTAVAMTSGSWTVAGVSYNYRSALQTADNPLASGVKAFSISATDAFGNSGTTGGFSVTIDSTRPTGTDVQAANTSGGTAGRLETGDTITFTYNEAMEPTSFLAGWDGSATSVTVRLIQQGGSDRLQIWDAANTTQVPLGFVRLGRTDYITVGTVNFTGSTMVLSGGTLTITLGTPSGAVGTAAGTGTMTWSKSTTPTDIAGNLATAGNQNESGAADFDF